MALAASGPVFDTPGRGGLRAVSRDAGLLAGRGYALGVNVALWVMTH